MAKYKNIVGTGFPDYVAEQFKTRQTLLENQTRNNQTLQYLTNRNSFIRLSSGVDMTDSEGRYTSKFALCLLMCPTAWVRTASSNCSLKFIVLSYVVKSVSSLPKLRVYHILKAKY